MANERHSVIFSSNQLIALLILLWCTVGITLYRAQNFGGSGTPKSLDANLDCGPCVAPADQQSYCMQLPNQYSKVIWYITDGWAYFRAKSVLELYQDNSILFTHSVSGERWSHAIYTSWWSGLPPVNIFGRAIVGDQLWESLTRAKGQRCEITLQKTMNPSSHKDYVWIGPSWSPLDMGGGPERFSTDYNFDVNIVVEEIEAPGIVVYPTIQKDVLPSLLQQLETNNQSLIAHSGLYDKSCHYKAQDKKIAWGQVLTDYFSAPILKDFVDAHPDYLLIISSDHGNMEVDSPYFHGEEHTNAKGNIGFVMLYAANLPSQGWQEIDVVDVLPTVCKYLKGCDIPFFSSGIFKGTYGNDTQGLLNAKKQNLNQLIKHAKYESLSLDYNSMEKLIYKGTVDDLPAIDKYLAQLKGLLYEARPTDNKVLAAFYVFVWLILLFGWIAFIVKVTGKSWSTLLVLLPALPLEVALLKIRYFTVSFFTIGLWGITNLVLCFGLNVFERAKRFYLLQCFGVILLLWELTLLLKDVEITFVMGFLGGALFTLLGYYSNNKELFCRKLQLVYGLGLMAFFATINVQSFYFVAGFHAIAFAIYASVFPMIGYFLTLNQWGAIGIPLAAWLLLIRSGDLAVVSLVALYEYVFPKFLNLANRNKSTQLSCQVMIVFLIMHITWFFYGNHSTYDWEVNPMWGSMGIDSWNRYPTLSGIFMGVAKFGIFFMNTFYLLELFTTHYNQWHDTLQFAIMWTCLPIFYCCLNLHRILFHFTPKYAFKAMINTAGLMTFTVTVWILYELIVRRKQTPTMPI